MIGLLIALVPVLVAIAFFFYFFFRRMFSTFGANTKNKWAISALILLAILATLASAQIMSVVSIIMLHIVFIGLIVQFVNFLIKKIVNKKYDDKFSVWKKIYGSGVLPILLTVVVMILGCFNLHNVVSTNYTVYTDKPIRTDGYRVALIADVHFGVSLDSEKLKQKCDEISDDNVDFVILCGDIVDNSTTADEMKTVFETFGKIQSKYGVFYTYGNHDRPMSLLKSDYTQEELANVIENAGITILQDETEIINGELALIGREDRMKDNRNSVDALVTVIDTDKFILVADHQPNQYDENVQANVDLIVSGHTHGGQIFPLNVVMKVFGINDGVYGQYMLSENTQAIVTSGLAGWSYPIKTAAPAEYVIIDILPNK